MKIKLVAKLVVIFNRIALNAVKGQITKFESDLRNQL